MRTKRRDDSSLELLLDTITNTFGGILFLAILIALLVRTTASQNAGAAASVEPLTAAEVAQFEARIEELEADIAAIRRRMTASQPEASEKQNASLVALDDVTRRLEASMLARAESLRRTAHHQQEAEATATRLDELDTQQKAAEQQLVDATMRRDAALADAEELSRAALEMDKSPGSVVIEQTVGLPRIRPTDKTEVAIYVRFGRLYLMHRWDRGIRSGPNTEQFVVIPGSPQVARPKPAAGIAIAPSSIDREVARLFAAFSPDRFYVTCVVFEDSFDVFQSLKAALVRRGFEYRPMARRPGQPVYDTGGTGEAQ